jgi:hypothetical protein
MLGESDNALRIFESLNAKGRPLAQADRMVDATRNRLRGRKKIGYDGFPCPGTPKVPTTATKGALVVRSAWT